MLLRAKTACLIAASVCLLGAGCAGSGFSASEGGRVAVETWAGARGFRAVAIASPPFDLFSLLRQRHPHPEGILVIYIEGDGAPWPSAYQPPRDPTPRPPQALLLAEQDPSPSVAYLARPCQYLDDGARRRCASEYWAGRRYSPEVLEAMNAALDTLKQRSGARQLSLVGYSGGGVIAALLASRRPDVSELITIAAPLALSEWVATNGLSPLYGSLDPLTQPPLQTGVQATHFVGARDNIVAPALVAHYVAERGGRLVQVDDFDHDCCWQRDWPSLLARARIQEVSR